MKKIITKRKLRYGSSAAALTVLVVAAVVVFNVIAAALVARYEWFYINMNTSPKYSVSETCKEYIDRYVISEVDEVNDADSGSRKIKLIFCDTRKNIDADLTLKYIHDSIDELADFFPGYFDISYLNVWESPSEANKYGVDSTADIVFAFGDRYETMNVTDFYVFSASDLRTPVAYNGDKIIASCLMRITQAQTPVCYFTANHGEDFSDYELMRAVIEAGYDAAFLDLAREDIPDDCDLLITCAPKQDMAISDPTNSQSEIEKLEKYMNAGGKYMVFVSADTFASGGFENFEAFLESWGVRFMHSEGKDGSEHTYLIKDAANSLTVDGYTVLSRSTESGIGSKVLAGANYPTAFGNSTCISFADDFKADGNGSYTADTASGRRIASPLLVTHAGAQAWAGGRAVARADVDGFTLMSITEQKCANSKTAYLVASASTEFVGEELMQSSVIGNGRALTEMMRYMGKENAPVDILFKPFSGTDIDSISTFWANTLTISLSLIPAITLTVVGVVVLVRRRHS